MAYAMCRLAFSRRAELRLHKSVSFLLPDVGVILSLGRAKTSQERSSIFSSGFTEVGLGGAAVTPKWDLGARRFRRSGTSGRRQVDGSTTGSTVAPPWTLVSPTGVQYHVLNRAELDALADAEGDGDGLKDDLHKLVRWACASTASRRRSCRSTDDSGSCWIAYAGWSEPIRARALAHHWRRGSLCQELLSRTSRHQII
jgi:hypothetical protein